MRTQRERVEESKRRLAEAAIELIAERGFSQTTSKDIGLHAGYSRAMVAERFGSKEVLLDFVLGHYYENRIDVQRAPGSSGLDVLLSPIEGLKEFARDDPRTLRAMFVLNFEAVHHTDVLRKRIRAWIRRLKAELIEAAQAAQADGSMRTDVDPVDVVTDMLATGIGHAYAWIVLPEDDDFERTMTRWHADLSSSLRAPATRRRSRTT
ncbi:TetR/AcrR family transcriptional regulator [Mycolicibacterium palauense]|uniref:TetR/AcrR family transcriptional regulator n=1 Tax=Mycolicibacterium palauense TaxID=2034511 RepID=UPI000BFEC8BB|nr:TetR/AcrR family transcriptional regulator [Mycolicibacterium palauense]